MGSNHSNLSSSEKLIIIGRIGAPFGVKGWVKINSYTAPKENIINFKKWFLLDNNKLSSIEPVLLEIKQLNNKFVALFQHVNDCNQAALLTNKQIAITRNCLPKLSSQQYYWEDLISCQVYNISQQYLGKVDYLFSTAANDVLVVKNSQNNQEYLIPYSATDFIIKIDLDAKTIIVDWSV